MLLPFVPLPIKGHSRVAVPQSSGLQAAYLHVSVTQVHAVLHPRGSKLSQRAITASEPFVSGLVALRCLKELYADIRLIRFQEKQILLCTQLAAP